MVLSILYLHACIIVAYIQLLTVLLVEHLLFVTGSIGIFYCPRIVHALQKQEGCFNPACLPQLQFKDQKTILVFCTCTAKT